MKIVEALITEIKEAVTTRDICGGVALMHGKLTVTAIALLDDGRCVRFNVPLSGFFGSDSGVDESLRRLNRSLTGETLNPIHIIEDLSTPQQAEEPALQKPRDLEI